MRTIKFSHKYAKLALGDKFTPEAELLQALRIHYKDLSEPMITYDTLYVEDKVMDIYELPETELILLIFKSSIGAFIFTTLRRYTPKKWDYYKASEGEIFKVEYT